MAIASGYGGGGSREISRESPGKSEPGYKPVIRLVASLPRAAAIVDGGPVSSMLGTSGQALVPTPILLRADEVMD
jgi:hypothetical protein